MLPKISKFLPNLVTLVSKLISKLFLPRIDISYFYLSYNLEKYADVRERERESHMVWFERDRYLVMLIESE